MRYLSWSVLCVSMAAVASAECPAPYAGLPDFAEPVTEATITFTYWIPL